MTFAEVVFLPVLESLSIFKPLSSSPTLTSTDFAHFPDDPAILKSSPYLTFAEVVFLPSFGVSAYFKPLSSSPTLTSTDFAHFPDDPAIIKSSPYLDVY